jgi:hypothetical protein
VALLEDSVVFAILTYGATNVGPRVDVNVTLEEITVLLPFKVVLADTVSFPEIEVFAGTLPKRFFSVICLLTGVAFGLSITKSKSSDAGAVSDEN